MDAHDIKGKRVVSVRQERVTDPTRRGQMWALQSITFEDGTRLEFRIFNFADGADIIGLVQKGD